MFSPKVIVWGGLASLCAGLFWILTGLAPNAGTFVLALVLGLGGLVSLYSRQSGQGGRLGLAGFVLGILGTALALAAQWWGSASGRMSNTVLVISLALIILGVGLTLLGIASLRAKIAHIWRGLPLCLGLLSAIQGLTIWLVFYLPFSQGRNPWDSWNLGLNVLFPAVQLLVGLGWMGLGIMLATEADAKVAQPPPASAQT